MGKIAVFEPSIKFGCPKHYYGKYLTFLKILGPKVKGQDHNMTEYGQKNILHHYPSLYVMNKFLLTKINCCETAGLTNT